MLKRTFIFVTIGLLTNLLVSGKNFNSYESVKLNDSTIYWCDSIKLSLNDFKAKRSDIDSAYFNAFGAVSSISFKFHITNKGDTLLIDVKSAFNRFKSAWFTEKNLLEGRRDLLLHEQGHFDIAEIFVRRIRKYLSNSLLLVENRKQIDEKIWQIYLESEELNKRYDNEVKENQKAQQNWSNWIKFELDNLKEFAKPCLDSK
jgi:hypothetical protein